MGKLILILLLIIVALGGGYYYVAERSDDAVPGDTFYAFDRIHEDFWQKLTHSSDKIGFELDLYEERISELQVLADHETSFDDLTEAINEIILQDANTVERISDTFNLDDIQDNDLSYLDTLKERRDAGFSLVEEIAERYNIDSKIALKTSKEISMQKEMDQLVEDYKSQIDENTFNQ